MTDAKGERKPATRRGFGRLRKLPSGRWQAAYVGPDGMLHKAPQTFPGKELAEGWLGGVLRAIQLGAWRSPAERDAAARAASQVETNAALTVGEYVSAWLERRIDPTHPRPLRPTTVADYRRLVDLHILPSLGGVRLVDLDADVVSAWHRKLGANGTPRARTKAYSLLRTIMGDAVYDKRVPHVTENPCRIKGAGLSPRNLDLQPATLDELGKIVAAMPDRLRLAVELAAWAALRYGEVFELRRGDIDPNAGVVHVRRGVAFLPNSKIVGRPKTRAGLRKVTIPPHLKPRLAEHLREFVEPGKNALLFPAPNGGQLRPSSFEVHWVKARAAAERPDLRFHDLRHTGAVLAAQAGATVAELMGRLGHATPQMAMHYQHASAERDRQIAERLSKMAAEV